MRDFAATEPRPRGAQGTGPREPGTGGSRHGVLARTHHVGSDDGEQAAHGEHGQGHAQQRVGLHALGGGPERRPGRAAALGAQAQVTVPPGGTGALGAGEPGSPPRGSATVPALEPGDASGWERGWAWGTGGRGRGLHFLSPTPMSPPELGQRLPTHQQLVSEAQAQHQAQHAGHQPEGHPQSHRPAGAGDTPKFRGGLLGAEPPTRPPPTPQHPGPQAHSAPCPNPHPRRLPSRTQPSALAQAPGSGRELQVRGAPQAPGAPAGAAPLPAADPPAPG